jgi:hypothetical protein
MRGRIPDMDIRLPDRLMRRLRRESAGDAGFVRMLTAEAIARRWFLSERIPCWCSPDPPGTDGRYSLVFANGSRSMVDLPDGNGSSFDSMAKARCEWLVVVRLSGGQSGHPCGFLRIGESVIRTPRLLRDLLVPPRFFTPAYLMGSLRMLVAGERGVPDPPDAVPPRACCRSSGVE